MKSLLESAVKEALSFATKEAALEHTRQIADDGCIDNERFAFVDDEEAVEAYEKARQGGCCGAVDAIVLVEGRAAFVGLNFGH